MAAGSGALDLEASGHAGQFQYPANRAARTAEDSPPRSWHGVAGGGEYPHRRAVDEGDVGEVKDEPFRPLLQHSGQRERKRVLGAHVEFATDDDRGRGATETHAYDHVLRV